MTVSCLPSSLGVWALFRQSPRCVPPVLAGKKLAEEGIPASLRLRGRPSGLRAPPTFTPTPVCTDPGFRALPGAPTQACHHANSPGGFHSQGLQPGGEGSRAQARYFLLHPPGRCGLCCSAPYSCSVPTGLDARGSICKRFFTPFSSYSLRSSTSPCSEVAVYPCWLTSATTLNLPETSL